VRLVDRLVELLDQRVVGAGVDLWSVEADILCTGAGYAPERAAPDHLTFHFSPFRAEVVWLARGGHAERVDVYAPLPSDEVAQAVCGRWQRSAITRTATVPIHLLLTAAKARLETSPRRGSKRPRTTRRPTEGDSDAH
jgi:hypothetical protein